jgi:hypothetical protein
MLVSRLGLRVIPNMLTRVFQATNYSCRRSRLQLGITDLRALSDHFRHILRLQGQEGIRRTCDRGRGQERALQMKL